jgi:hypothetical protein
LLVKLFIHSLPILQWKEAVTETKLVAVTVMVVVAVAVMVVVAVAAMMVVVEEGEGEEEEKESFIRNPNPVPVVVVVAEGFLNIRQTAGNQGQIHHHPSPTQVHHRLLLLSLRSTTVNTKSVLFRVKVLILIFFFLLQYPNNVCDGTPNFCVQNLGMM